MCLGDFIRGETNTRTSEKKTMPMLGDPFQWRLGGENARDNKMRREEKNPFVMEMRKIIRQRTPSERVKKMLFR